jgi:hypothetical protein
MHEHGHAFSGRRAWPSEIARRTTDTRRNWKSEVLPRTTVTPALACDLRLMAFVRERVLVFFTSPLDRSHPRAPDDDEWTAEQRGQRSANASRHK